MVDELIAAGSSAALIEATIIPQTRALLGRRDPEVVPLEVPILLGLLPAGRSLLGHAGIIA